MKRTFVIRGLSALLAVVVAPTVVFAGGRGGGYSHGGGGYSGGGGSSAHSPSFSQSSSSHPQQSEGGNRSQYGNTSDQHSNAGSAAAGADYANKNQKPVASNAGAAAAGADYSNKNQKPGVSNAAAGADYSNKNQKPGVSNAGAAAAGADYADKNQKPNMSTAGAAAAGAGYSNRNQQTGVTSAGAAAAGAGYANRNQPNGISNAGAAAAGAGYANRNQYDQYHPGMGGAWNGKSSNSWGMGSGGYGNGNGYGNGGWGAGSSNYGGYSNYSNPYGSGGIPQQPFVPSNAPIALAQPDPATPAPAVAPYNYSQALNAPAPQPGAEAASLAASVFDQARSAFQAGDYADAAKLTQQALASMPNDVTMHEFLALVYFAQGKYDLAAAPLYAILSAGPGWNWTTLIANYADANVYTTQLRALEANIRANPKSAQAHFVLAYHYLTQGHDDSAHKQFQQAVTLQPNDKLSAQLLSLFHAEGVQDLQPTQAILKAPAKEGKLTGTWTAMPDKNTTITFVVKEDGKFTWVVTSGGKSVASIGGEANFANGSLGLNSAAQNGTMTGLTIWKDDTHFNFKIVGGPQEDPGLNFSH